jgi:hypothetical protein
MVLIYFTAEAQSRNVFEISLRLNVSVVFKALTGYLYLKVLLIGVTHKCHEDKKTKFLLMVLLKKSLFSLCLRALVAKSG